MPLYESKCEKCGHSVEEVRTYDQGARKKCPKCKGKMHQVFDGKAPGILIHGHMYGSVRSRRGKVRENRKRK